MLALTQLPRRKESKNQRKKGGITKNPVEKIKWNILKFWLNLSPNQEMRNLKRQSKKFLKKWYWQPQLCQ